MTAPPIAACRRDPSLPLLRLPERHGLWLPVTCRRPSNITISGIQGTVCACGSWISTIPSIAAGVWAHRGRALLQPKENRMAEQKCREWSRQWAAALFCDRCGRATHQRPGSRSAGRQDHRRALPPARPISRQRVRSIAPSTSRCDAALRQAPAQALATRDDAVERFRREATTVRDRQRTHPAGLRLLAARKTGGCSSPWSSWRARRWPRPSPRPQRSASRLSVVDILVQIADALVDAHTLAMCIAICAAQHLFDQAARAVTL